MKLSFVIFLVVAIAGCAITSREATTDLPGTSWELVEIDGAAPAADPPPTLTFGEDGTVSGNAGCNTFTGGVTIDGTSLTFGPLATTRMACADAAVGDQEQAFLLAMDEVTGYTIDEEGRLVLEGGTSLVFEVAAEAG